MNPIQFECPHCQAVITGDESLHGQRVKCEKCQGTLLVPDKPVPAGMKTARLLGQAGRTPVSAAAPAEETEVFALSPVARAFSGQILLGVLLLAGAVGLKVNPLNFPWAPWGALAALVAGLLCFLLVWIKVKSSSYRLTTQRLFVRRGWMAKHTEELELYRVKDVLVDQGLWQRLLGYGTITVIADDDTTPKLELVQVASPVENKERIRTHYRAARQREGVRPTEFMHSP